MKVYLAAPYSEMKLMRGWRSLLEAAGHTCTAKWIDGNEEGMTLHDAAQMDLDDVDAADAVISKVLPKGTMFSSGGRHVEFGYGLAKAKIMLTVSDGTEENIFHHLSYVAKCASIEQAITVITPKMTP